MGNTVVCVVWHKGEVVGRVPGHFTIITSGDLMITNESNGLSTVYASGQWDMLWEEYDE